MVKKSDEGIMPNRSKNSIDQQIVRFPQSKIGCSQTKLELPRTFFDQSLIPELEPTPIFDHGLEGNSVSNGARSKIKEGLPSKRNGSNHLSQTRRISLSQLSLDPVETMTLKNELKFF